MGSGERVAGSEERGASSGERRPKTTNHGPSATCHPALHDARPLHHHGLPEDLQHVCPQRFIAPLAPPRAAHEENKSVDSQRLRDGLETWRERADIVLVEGAGGLMSPLAEDSYNADLARDFGFPLVVVAPNQLGTINATLQTIITANHFGLRVAGVVLNQPSANREDASVGSNREELERRCDAPVLAEVAHGGRFDATVDWWELAESGGG